MKASLLSPSKADKLFYTFRGRIILALRHVAAYRKQLLALLLAGLGTWVAFIVAAFSHGSFGLAEAASQLTYPGVVVVVALGSTMLLRALDVRFTPSRLERLLVLQKFALEKQPQQLGEDLTYRLAKFDQVSKFFEPTDEGLFIFPGHEERDVLLQEASRLNCLSFSNTFYADDLTAKHARNGSHQRRNPHALMLVHNRANLGKVGSGTPDKYVGFTHLIPVDEASYGRYVNGEIADKTFNAEHVCKETKEAWAIILFSLGVYGYRVKELAQGTALSWYDLLLERIGVNYDDRSVVFAAEHDLWLGCLYHLHTLFATQCFAQDKVRLVAQSLNPRLIKVLLLVGFEPLGRNSADGEPLFELRVVPDIIKRAVRKVRKADR